MGATAEQVSWIGVEDLDRIESWELYAGLSRRYLSLEVQEAVLKRGGSYLDMLSLNPWIHETVVERILTNTAGDIPYQLAGNTHLSEDFQVRIAQCSKTTVRLTQARVEGLGEKVRTILSMDKDLRVQKELGTSHWFEVTEDYGARFVHNFRSAYYVEMTEGCDEETLRGLLKGCEGTLRDLKVAAELVQR